MAELAGDLGLVDAGGEQLGGAEPAGLEPVALSLCRRAARDGWYARDPHPHPPSSPAPTRPRALLSPTPRTPFNRATWLSWRSFSLSECIPYQATPSPGLGVVLTGLGVVLSGSVLVTLPGLLGHSTGDHLLRQVLLLAEGAC